jgi:DNA primase
VARDLCDVELLRAGHQEKGCCPIHLEDTPSFYVNDSKGVFHCFGCGAGGDSITLVQEVHHLGFHDALYRLAEAAGVDVAKYERPLTDEEKAREAFRAWCEGWVSGLAPDGSRVGLPVAREYGVGVGAQHGPPPPSYFDEKGYLLRGTVFPYRDARGRLVGWKARGADKTFYLTPADFPLWEPCVGGLDRALPHVEDQLIVVEGEYDALYLISLGVRNVVWIGGSKWTDEQMQILEDHKIKRVLFWLDGDEPGRGAAERIATRHWRHPSVQVRIALAPWGADPEDICRAMGTAAVPEGRSALEWLLWQEWSSTPRSSLSAKLEFVTWVRTEYGEHLNGVETGLVLKTVAEWLEVPEADVLDFVRAEQTVLQAPDSEKIVLGRAVREDAYFRTVRKRITLDDFHVIKHRRLWAVLEAYMAEGLEWDVLTISRKALDQGVSNEYVEQLAELGDHNIGWHEDQVIDLATRRGVRQDADRFRDLIGDLKTPASQLIGQLTHSVTSKALQRGSAAFRSIADQADEAMDILHTRMKNPDDVIGIPFGTQFPMLTRNLQGAQARRFMLVAATSGKGKSTLTLQWCAAWAMMAVPVDFISLEMDEIEILFKMCSHLTGIDSMKISSGRLDPQEAKRVEAAMMRLRMSPLRIYAPDGITTNEFLLYAREAKMERRTEVFVVDYAQMVGRDPEDRDLRRDEQLGRFAYTSKLKIARGLDACVIACAQLRRDAATKDEPTPEDMGDSYDLSRAADVVILIGKPEDSSMYDIWIGKNRQGPPQVRIPSYYDKPNQTFSEPSGAKVPDYRILSAA